MTPNAAQSALSNLISRLDAAVCPDSEATCERVKIALEEAIADRQDFLAEEFMKPSDGAYARRLVHRDAEGRYSVVAMVWGVGQGTPLHDHAGSWCVECVYRGRIRVVSYSLVSEDGDRLTFREEDQVFAGVGEAGKLIPPFDYHTIENADLGPSVTLHVYGGELTWCHAFMPEGDGVFVRVKKPLTYTA